MGEAKAKKNFFKSLKGEFKKIIWPDKNDVIRRSIAVVLITIILGLVIVGLDTVIMAGVDYICLPK